MRSTQRLFKVFTPKEATYSNPEQVILLAGPGARAYNKELVVQAEQALTIQGRKSIVTIGDGEKNLSTDDMEYFFNTISASKEHLLLVILGHGYIEPGLGHSFNLMGWNRAVYSANFLRSITLRHAHAPLDVFTTTCYAGKLAPYAKSFLPEHSSYVALSPDIVSSCAVKRLMQDVSNQSEINSHISIEKLLLTYLTKSLKSRFTPLVTTRHSASAMLHGKLVSHVGQPFTDNEKQLVMTHLEGFVSTRKVSLIMRAIENAKSEAEISPECYGTALAICHAASGDLDYGLNKSHTKTLD